MTAFANFADIPRGHYQAICADPPWSFKAWSEKGLGRSASQHYRVLPFDELAAFPVADLAADRCALFLWVVRSNLPEAMRLIDAWGFTFKSTAFVWAKTCTRDPGRFRIGFGKWTRTGASVRELITAPIARHSEKPVEICDRISGLVDGPYLELFGRRTMPGWDVFGDAIEHGNIKDKDHAP